MNNKNWFEEQYERLEKDPKYIAAGLMIEINEKFCERMKELGMSQRDLAKAIGKTQPYVSKVLNRGTNMTLETLAMFAVALDMDVKAPELTPKSFVLSNVVTIKRYKQKPDDKDTIQCDETSSFWRHTGRTEMMGARHVPISDAA